MKNKKLTYQSVRDTFSYNQLQAMTGIDKGQLTREEKKKGFSAQTLIKFMEVFKGIDIDDMKANYPQRLPSKRSFPAAKTE